MLLTAATAHKHKATKNWYEIKFFMAETSRNTADTHELECALSFCLPTPDL